MGTKIATKFEVGDRVWAIWLSPALGKYINRGSEKITEQRKRKKLYCLNGDIWEKEDNIFRTEEEALAECDKRNA